MRTQDVDIFESEITLGFISDFTAKIKGRRWRQGACKYRRSMPFHHIYFAEIRDHSVVLKMHVLNRVPCDVPLLCHQFPSRPPSVCDPMIPYIFFIGFCFKQEVNPSKFSTFNKLKKNIRHEISKLTFNLCQNHQPWCILCVQYRKIPGRSFVWCHLQMKWYALYILIKNWLSFVARLLCVSCLFTDLRLLFAHFKPVSHLV